MHKKSCYNSTSRLGWTDDAKFVLSLRMFLIISVGDISLRKDMGRIFCKNLCPKRRWTSNIATFSIVEMFFTSSAKMRAQRGKCAITLARATVTCFFPVEANQIAQKKIELAGSCKFQTNTSVRNTLINHILTSVRAMFRWTHASDYC